jgi:hypothetical protein
MSSSPDIQFQMSTACHPLAGAGHQWTGENVAVVYAQARRLELEQGLDGSTQASIGVCEKKRVLARLIRAKAHTHGAIPWTIHGEQKKKMEWKRGEERDVTGTSSLPASSSSSNSSSAPNTRHQQHLWWWWCDGIRVLHVEDVTEA